MSNSREAKAKSLFASLPGFDPSRHLGKDFIPTKEFVEQLVDNRIAYLDGLLEKEILPEGCISRDFFEQAALQFLCAKRSKNPPLSREGLILLLTMIFKTNLTGNQEAMNFYHHFDDSAVHSAVHENMFPARSTLASNLKKFSFEVEKGTVIIRGVSGYEVLALQSVFPLAIIHYNKHFPGKPFGISRIEELARHLKYSKIGITGRRGILGFLAPSSPNPQYLTNAKASAKKQTNGLVPGPSKHQIASQSPTTCRPNDPEQGPTHSEPVGHSAATATPEHSNPLEPYASLKAAFAVEPHKAGKTTGTKLITAAAGGSGSSVIGEPSGANDAHMFQLKEALLACNPAKLVLAVASSDPKELDAIEKVAKELIAFVTTTKAMLGAFKDDKTDARKSRRAVTTGQEFNQGEKHASVSETPDDKGKAAEQQKTRPNESHASVGENPEDGKDQDPKQHQDRPDKYKKIPGAKSSATSHQTAHRVVPENESNNDESNDAVIHPPREGPHQECTEEASSGDLPMEDCGLNLPATGVSENKFTDDGTTGLIAVKKNVFGLIRPSSTDTKNQSNDMHQPRDGSGLETDKLVSATADQPVAASPFCNQTGQKRVAKEVLESTPPKRRSVSHSAVPDSQAATTSPDLSNGQVSDHSAVPDSRATTSPGLSSGQADNIVDVSAVPDSRAATGSPDGSPDLCTDEADNNVDHCSPDLSAVPEARRVAEEGKLATSQLLHSHIGFTRKEINQNQAWKAIGLTKKFGSGAGLAPNLAYLSVEAGQVALDEDTPGMLTVTFLLPGPERIKIKEQLDSLEKPIALFWTESQLESGERLWHYIGHYQCEKICEEEVTFSASFCWNKFHEKVATKLDEIAADGATVACCSH
ncbi:expressed unknown protein [Seminavis robusta]|uniref:Uncharacterized protein n=1 Tax=Seminavis robusta TaxID=568900 RepID=A0A9N8HKA8_9STRA|nr:expressed unknown protein [Seminavis robusta]|eukprot:Sro927_g221160.1 n/a (872) ;mRNA; r:27435-30050